MVEYLESEVEVEVLLAVNHQNDVFRGGVRARI